MLDLENLPIYWVNRLSVMARRELGNRFKTAGHDVSPEEWAILMLLWREDKQSPGAMAQRTVRDATTMTRLVDAMVRKGMVERREDAHDRRRSLICLTGQGRKLQGDLEAVAKPMIGQAMAGVLPTDAKIVMRVLKMMVENLAREKGDN